MSWICDKYELSLDEGMRMYSMFETLLGIQNLLMGVVYTYAQSQLESHHPTTGLTPAERKRISREKVMFLCVGIGLLCQGLTGLLLYHFGYKNRSALSCWTWMISAAYNLFCFGIAIAGVCIKLTEWIILVRLLHLAYNVLGIPIIYSFNGSTPILRRRIGPMKLSSSSDDLAHLPDEKRDSHHRDSLPPTTSATTSTVTATATETETDTEHRYAAFNYPPLLEPQKKESETSLTAQSQPQPTSTHHDHVASPSHHHPQRHHERDHHHRRGEGHHRKHRSR